jgi:hypothetical protein
LVGALETIRKLRMFGAAIRFPLDCPFNIISPMIGQQTVDEDLQWMIKH